MPAARDYDWKHTRVIGEKADAVPYLSFANKLLGYVKQDAAYNQLGTHSITKQLPDGAVITAEIHGAIPRVTITPPKGGAGQPLVGLDRFVVLASGDGLMDGIDPQYPEQWLDVPGVTRKEDSGWCTRFYDADVSTFAAFEGTKGIYSAIQGRDAFRRGVPRYGNLDHRNKDGYRVSWYGPSSRSCADGYVNPAVIWRTKVFMHGRMLLDTMEYQTASPETGVLAGGENMVVYGAGYYGGHLYVVQGQTVDTSPNSAPSYPVGAGYITDPTAFNGSSPVPETMFLCRYAVAEGGPPGALVQHRVVKNSREVLWSANFVGRDPQPWHFNPDCTEATSFTSVDTTAQDGTLGPHIVFVARVKAEPARYDEGFQFGLFAHFDDVDFGAEVLPYDHDLRHTLYINDVGASLVSQPVTLDAGGGSAVLLRDYDEDGNHVDLNAWRGTYGGETGILAFDMDGHRWPLQWQSAANEITRHYLLHADLPTHTLVFARARCAYELGTEPETAVSYLYTGGSVELQVWRHGALVHSKVLDNVVLGAASEYASMPGVGFAVGTGLDHYGPHLHMDIAVTLWEALDTIPLCPSILLYGAVHSAVRFGWVGGDDGTPRSAVITGAFGGGAMFANLAYPTGFTFGWYRYPFAGNPDTKFETDRTALYANEIDRDGSYTPLAAATLGEHTILSCYTLVTGDERACLHLPETGADSLPALTGSEPAHARYHPLWRLGRFDLSPPETAAT